MNDYKLRYRIALSDESPFITRATKGFLLSNFPGCNILTYPLDGKLLLQGIRKNPVDFLITDFSSNHEDVTLDGIERIKEINRCAPDVKIIILTSHKNESILLNILKYRVWALVSKSDECEELINALYYKDSKIKGAYLSARMKVILSNPDVGHKGVLTSSEVEVIRQIALGYSLTDIAKSRKRSVSTISTQKYNAMRKLLLTSTTDLIKYAYVERMI